jgi:hypothetical protein
MFVLMAMVPCVVPCVDVHLAYCLIALFIRCAQGSWLSSYGLVVVLWLWHDLAVIVAVFAASCRSNPCNALAAL